MYLILKLFHVLSTSFRLYCFSSDTSYLSMSDFHASCEISLHCLAIPKGIYVSMIISKTQVLLFTSKFFSWSVHLLHHLIWEFPILLWDTSGYPCVLQLIWFSISTHHDVSDGYRHLISFLFDAWYLLLLSSLPCR